MTEVYKLHRKDADTTSIESAEKVKVNRLEKIVYEVIDNFGTSGCIQDDVLQELHDYPYSTVTARFKALEEKNMIVRCEHTRKGKRGRKQRIMMSKRFYDGKDIYWKDARIAEINTKAMYSPNSKYFDEVQAIYTSTASSYQEFKNKFISNGGVIWE